MEEKDRDSKSCVGLFDPSLGFRLRWDMALAIIIIYSCLVGPYRMAFKVPALEGWFVFELLCDALFLVDICLNFNTAYFNQDDILVTNRRQIALNYLSFWFWLDLLSTVPIDLIMDSIGLEAGDSSGAQFKLLRLTRLVRLIKLTRLAKLQAFFKKLEEDDIVDLNTMRYYPHNPPPPPPSNPLSHILFRVSGSPLSSLPPFLSVCLTQLTLLLLSPPLYY